MIPRITRMRIVGKRRFPPLGLRGPTDAEILASTDSSLQAPRVVPKGVYRYRTHAEANAAMDRWVVDGMVEKARDLARKAD
jgi:hypothetical protein